MKILSTLMLTCGLVFGAFCSDKVESLTQEQADTLADRIMENTPEYIFARGSKFEWIVLEDIKGNPEMLNTAVLERIKKKYKIFDSRKDIPEEFKIYSDGKFVGYQKGFTFEYKVTFNSADTVTINYSDFEGNLGGSIHWKQYKWNGKEWIMIDKSSLIVA